MDIHTFLAIAIISKRSSFYELPMAAKNFITDEGLTILKHIWLDFFRLFKLCVSFILLLVLFNLMQSENYCLWFASHVINSTAAFLIAVNPKWISECFKICQLLQGSTVSLTGNS